MIATIGFVLLLSSAKINVGNEVAVIESNIEQEYLRFDVAFDLFQNNFPSHEKVNGVDFLVYDQTGNLVSWSDYKVVPRLEEFLISGSDYLLITGQGEFLFKGYDWSNSGENYKVFAISKIRRIIETGINTSSNYYNHQIIPANIEISYGADALPVRFRGKEIFNVSWDGRDYYENRINWIGLLILVLVYLGAFIFFYQLAKYLIASRNYRFGLSAFLLLILVFRSVLIYYDFPSSYFKIGVFANITFQFGWFFFSLGDALLNVISLMVILVFVFQNRPNFEFKSSFVLDIIQLLILLASYCCFYLFTDGIQIILEHSQISLDIASSLDFPIERIFAYLLLCLLGISYFLYAYLSFEVLALKTIKVRKFLAFLLIAFLLATGMMHNYANVGLVVIGNTGYYLLLYFFQFPNNLKKLKFESLNYIIVSAVLLSSVGSYLVYKSHEYKEADKMQKFATYLQFDRDLEGEYRLSQVLGQIKSDVIINGKMMNPKLQDDGISKRIKRTHLSHYFNNYEVEVRVFDASGIEMLSNETSELFSDIKDSYQLGKYQTEFENVFSDAKMDLRNRNKLTCFVTLERYGNVTGYIMLQLRLKKFASKKVLPQLLVAGSSHSNDNYDYAIFNAGGLIFRSGDFEYDSKFEEAWFEDQDLFGVGIEKNNYSHLGVKMGERLMVVSNKIYPFQNIVSNFSFLFSLFLFAGSLALIYNYLILPSSNGALSFSAKILLYSGASFIIPLILVGTAVMGTTDDSNRREVDKSNLKKTRLMTENVNDVLVGFHRHQINKEELENEVAILSGHSGMDINIYNLDGRLLTSSTPAIFDSNIISEYLIPEAYTQIVTRKKESVTLSEQIGDFQFKTSYVGIQSSDSGELLGVLGTPYFSSKNHLKRQQLAVFGNIINIFTFVFIVSIIVASYVISRITRPIMAIADRLHSTGFANDNQPIEWETDDEIGVLINEYNNMLGKLEQSKVELSRNEKEAAWREMAKQVAHEIKNPLTPMKLTIQHLQRILSSKQENNKSLDLLLNQIDVLDEIVTSFSHFAQMPTPLAEPFDVIYVLEKSIDLHVDKSIEKVILSDKAVILGDEKLFGRVFNNLILNAFESMKKIKHPNVQVKLEIEGGNRVKISIQDFGEGIPDDVQGKVFIPNFTTKETGSGIGLAVAKRGIEHAGGEIWFETTLNKGTVFYIAMPLYKSEE